MAFSVGSVTAKLNAKIDSFTKSFSRAESALDKFGSKGKRLNDQLKAMQRQQSTLNLKLQETAKKYGQNSSQAQALRDRIAGVNDRIATQKMRMEEMSKKMDKAKTSTDRLKLSMGNLGRGIKTAAVVGVASIGALLASVGTLLTLGVKASATMEQLKTALLTTFQGSVEKTDKAFKQITEFAKKTPFQLQEVMTGFIKLSNMGLNPSERAMASYGDTASAMGKSLNDMVEAVADAATGEFERLKEFGIKASSQGNRVKFTFRGVEKTVRKDAKSIEEYLIRLGETNFAGGMERQSKTINGQMSTLKDNIEMTLADLSEKTGLSQFVRDGLGKLNDAFSKLDIDNIIKKFKEFGDKLKVVNEVGKQITDFAQKLKDKFFEVANIIQTYLAPEIKVVSDIIKMIIDNFKRYLLPVLAALSVTLLWVASNVLVVLKYAWDQLREPLREVFIALWDLWDALNPIIAVILTLVSVIVALLMPVLQVIFAFAIQMIKAIAFTATGFVKIITGVINIIVGLFEGLITGDFSRFKKGWVQMWDGVVLIVKGWWNSIKAPIVGVADGIKNTFKSIDLFKIATDMIQGLINGIADISGKVDQKVNEIADGIKNKFKDALKIQSPSKFTMEIGEFLGEGLSIGLDKSAADVMRSSNKMASNAVSPIYNTSQTINRNRQVTINNYDSSRRSPFVDYSVAF